MVEGTGLGLYMLIGAIMFGLFAGATAVFGDEVGAFVGGFVETVKEINPNEDVDNAGGEDDPNCVLATDEDFSGTVNGSFRYIGSSDCVRIPNVIKGVEVTSYQNMFNGTRVSKVISDNPNVTDMQQMFRDSLAAELDLSNFDTSNVTNMTGMFYDSNSRELDLSSFDTSNVINMYAMFYKGRVRELDLSNFDTSNVTNMSYMFAEMSSTYGNSTTTEIKGLEKFNTSNVTNMYGMFHNIRTTSLDLSNFDTSNVTDMGGMFRQSKATEIKGLDNFDTSKVTDMSWMFSSSQATDLVLSSFNTSKVRNMSNMFNYSQATEIKGLENFNTSNVITMYGMFTGIQPTVLDLSSFDTSNVTRMDRMFLESQAKTVYARTQADANKFNASYGKPIGLQVIVKQ